MTKKILPMKLSNRYLPFIALTLAAILWGANTPIMKYTLAHVPLFTLGFLRFFVAALILFPFVYKNLTYHRKDLFPLFLSALLGITIIITLFFFGIRLTTALNAGVIGGTTPIFTLLAAYIFLHEKISRNMLIGAAIGLFGLFIIIGKDIFTQGLAVSPMGDTLLILANIVFAAYITLSKELANKYSPMVFTFFVFFFGGLMFLPGVIMEFHSYPGWYNSLPIGAYTGVLYGIVFAALIAFLLWQYGLSKVAESQVGLFLYISPIVSTILAIFFLGEQITEEFLIGTLFIIIGLIVAEAHLRHKHHHIH